MKELYVLTFDDGEILSRKSFDKRFPDINRDFDHELCSYQLSLLLKSKRVYFDYKAALSRFTFAPQFLKPHLNIVKMTQSEVVLNGAKVMKGVIIKE